MTAALLPYTSLTAQQVETLRELQVTPEQLKACGSIESALYTLNAGPRQAVSGWALLHEQQPRGFFLLMRAPCLPSWAADSSALVMSLQVDHRYQGLGLGKTCLQALPQAAVRLWPGVDRLTLSVAPTNQAALGLYKRLGWVDCGPGHRAKVGYERQLVLQL
jgi:ribosomal protein S18 acetylase RimI-like enzyme